jgi:hypothetical protein
VDFLIGIPPLAELLTGTTLLGGLINQHSAFGSKVNLKSAIRNPQSKIQNRIGGLVNLKSTIQNPNPKNLKLNFKKNACGFNENVLTLRSHRKNHHK